MGKKTNKTKEMDFLQSEILRSRFITYTLDEQTTTKIIAVVMKALKQYFSICSRFLSGFRLVRFKKNLVTEQMYKDFTDAVKASAYVDKKIINRALCLSSATRYCQLDNFVRTTIADEVLKNCIVSTNTRATLRHDFINGRNEHLETERIADIIIRDMTYDKIMDIIRANPEYSNYMTYMDNILAESRESRKIILREIPENPVDAYPLAREIRRHFILHIGPTNSGKTYDALQAYKKALNGVYLAPLRLLAFEVFEKLNMENIPCDMLTGEEEINIPNARHISSTVEMVNLSKYYDVAVIDECQMISNWQRGGAWTEAILGVYAREVHLCAAPEAEKILIELIEMCGDSYEIERHQRFVPLEADEEEFVYPDSIKSRDALIVFSRLSVLKHAEELRRLGIKASVIYGSLPYDVRRNEVERFVRGETDVIVSTDAIGMGLNLPVKRIVFLETYKFDGKTRRFLNQSELKQIAGRAGRKGLYETGSYNSVVEMDTIVRRINVPERSIEKAVLRFPENIVTVDMPLSKILSQWSDIPDNGPFNKSDVSEKIRFSEKLETYTDDKRLIYKFITIPFNTGKSRLYFFWFDLFEKALLGENVTPAILSYDENMRLDTLELLYQKSDILYHYFRHFGKIGDMKAVMELKEMVSERIMQRLLDGFMPVDNAG